MLLSRQKRLPSGLICKLYNLCDVLKVARATHITQRKIIPLEILMNICITLKIDPNGTYKTLRARIATHMAYAANK